MRKTHPALLLFLVLAAACSAQATVTASGDLRIPTRGIGGQAVFFPYSSGGVAVEVLAVRAPDGTIRTALNTCQVCYSSGRGYYTQQGDVLVCNNCGNRFRISQIGMVRGGCNPVPITKEWKREEGQFIVISKDFLERAKLLFANLKKR